MALRRDREERGSERLPPPGEVTALQVSPESARGLVEEFFSKPVEPREGEAAWSDVERIIMRGLQEVRMSIVSQLRIVPQSTVTTINRRTIRNSIIMMLLARLSEISVKALATKTEIEGIVRDVVSGRVTREEYVGKLRRLYELVSQLLSLVYVVPVFIKDIDGVVNLNLPFHLQSDQVRKFIGYTATS